MSSELSPDQATDIRAKAESRMGIARDTIKKMELRQAEERRQLMNLLKTQFAELARPIKEADNELYEEWLAYFGSVETWAEDWERDASDPERAEEFQHVTEELLEFLDDMHDIVSDEPLRGSSSSSSSDEPNDEDGDDDEEDDDDE